VLFIAIGPMCKKPWCAFCILVVFDTERDTFKVTVSQQIIKQNDLKLLC